MSHESIEVIPLDRPASPQSGTTNRSSVLTRRDPAQHEKVKLLTHALLSVLGQDPGRPELRGTPRRVARIYAGLLSGYEVEIKTLLNGALFDVDYHLQPRGVAVIIDTFHVHTAMRGDADKTPACAPALCAAAFAKTLHCAASLCSNSNKDPATIPSILYLPGRPVSRGGGARF